MTEVSREPRLMDSFEFNKIAGAVLFAVLVGFGLSIVSET